MVIPPLKLSFSIPFGAGSAVLNDIHPNYETKICSFPGAGDQARWQQGSRVQPAPRWFLP
jgi:hypothetical protein